MALSYRARRVWSYVILLLGIPLYVVVTVSLMDWLREVLGRPAWWIEVSLFVALGFLWVLPFRGVFLGVGREDPDARQVARPKGD